MLKKAVRRLVSGDSRKDELEFKQNILITQLIAVGFLLLAGLVVYLVERLYPDFFNYPYLYIRFNKENLINFWPLFVYGTIMAYIGSGILASTEDDATILRFSVLTNIIAGIWEELGYRWLFVCTFMITIVVSNWLFSTFLGYILGGMIVMGGIIIVANSERKLLERLLGILSICSGLILVYISRSIDPIFWFYDRITLPIVNFVTLYQLENIIYNPTYPKLFIYGLVAANSSFKDGHKYQGMYGYFNSWIIGFILMYAMLTYGLTTAIIIHIIYDMEFSVIRYVVRKIDFM